jgi:hypothetical protein
VSDHESFAPSTSTARLPLPSPPPPTPVELWIEVPATQGAGFAVIQAKDDDEAARLAAGVFAGYRAWREPDEEQRALLEAAAAATLQSIAMFDEECDCC